jgi:hypothetical protein
MKLPSGAAVPGIVQSGALSATGGASMTLTPNGSIAPVPSTWNFTVCPQATAFCYIAPGSTIVGATQTVTLAPPVPVVIPGPLATAYTDAEISNPIPGSEYYNLVSNVQRVCNGPAPCTWGASGIGGAVPPGTTVSGSNITFPGSVTAGDVVIPAYVSPTSNLFIGTTAGNAGNATTTGIDSVGIGTNALSSMTTSSSPTANTALGFGACASVTTAREMTCLGFNAGNAFIGNGQGIQDGLSTFIGSQAGQAMVGSGATVTDFLFVGQKAGTNATGGGASILMGNHAGAGILTPLRSIAIGNVIGDQGSATMTSTDDVFIGYNVVHAGTGVFSSNTIIGENAASVATALFGDTIVGNQAGLALATGGQNVLFGYQAGKAITNNASDVFVGYQAASNATGSNEMAIGYQACANMTGGSNDFSMCLGNTTNLAAATDTNETVIGQGTTGAGSNTATIGNTSVTDVFEGGATAAAKEHATAYYTASNCSSSASPAVCGSASAGGFTIPAAATTVTVNTTAVTANSTIIVIEDDSLGTKLSVTCNTATSVPEPNISARVNATSFSVLVTVAPVTNPKCYSYFLVN